MAISTATRTAPRSSSSNRLSAVYHAASHSNRTLWVIQGVVAAIFLFAGVSKLVMPADTLAEDSALPVLFMRFIGVCETLGAFGLVLPGVFRIRQGLTPLAATGLVIIMAGAVTLTIIDMGVAPAIFPLVVGLACAFVATSRAR